MAISDKNGILDRLSERQQVRLDLGCGPAKRGDDWIGVDLLEYEGVDIIGDVFEVLQQIGDAAVDVIYSAHFFEHVGDLPRLIAEVSRVLKPQGQLTVIVPHFSNPYYYSDPMHRSFFGAYTFSYFADSQFLKRQVPKYGVTPHLELVDLKLVFKSSPPFYGRYAFKRLVQAIVNISTWTKEFYEDMLTGVIPCYEIVFTLRRK
jgi:ubiquinone/menaquinone biosynthesis C-methylase UbiE